VKGSKTFETNSSGEYTKKACEESLRRLGVDSIDLCKSSITLCLHFETVLEKPINLS
jgi:diketogulonate reductase-like aldo/keto reductase